MRRKRGISRTPKQRARRFAAGDRFDYSLRRGAAPRTLPLWLDAPLRRHRTQHRRPHAHRAQGASFVPAHRSHIDYHCCHLLHDNGFTPPHVAAGANFSTCRSSGACCATGGAFFLRRSFKGESRSTRRFFMNTCTSS